MKHVIFINSIMLLFFSNPAVAQSFPEVNKCLSGIHRVEHSNEGPYSSVLLAGNKLGGSLLVVTEKGAEVIQGNLNEKEQTLSFVFAAPGQKEKLMSKYQIQSNNELTELWMKNGVEDAPSPIRKVTAKEALTLAGQRSLERAQNQANDVEGQLNRFEQVMKGNIGSIKEKSRVDPRDGYEEMSELFNDQREVYAKYLSRLKSCEGLPDKNIQKAALIEKERLEKFQRKLAEISAAPVVPNNSKPANSTVK